MKNKVLYIVFDILFVLSSIFLFSYIAPFMEDYYIKSKVFAVLMYFGVWILVSFLIGKYSIKKSDNYNDITIPIAICNITFFVVISTIIYFFNVTTYSRLFIFGTVLLASSLELVYGYIIFYKTKIAKNNIHNSKNDFNRAIDQFNFQHVTQSAVRISENHYKLIPEQSLYSQSLQGRINKNILELIQKYTDLNNDNTLILSTKNSFNVEIQPDKYFDCIINFSNSDQFSKLSRFYSSVFHKLKPDGYYIGCYQTVKQRKKIYFFKHSKIKANILLLADSLLNRIIFRSGPLSRLFYHIYKTKVPVKFIEEKHQNILSELGYKMLEKKAINFTTYFVAKKFNNNSLNK